MSEISEVGLLEFVGVALIRNVFQEKGRNFCLKFCKIFAEFFRPQKKRLAQFYTASNFSEILQRLKKQESRTCDLAKLPPEGKFWIFWKFSQFFLVGVKVLKCLSATDLALASCVWSDLGSDWSIWADLCKRTWRGPASFYAKRPAIGWRQLYLLLDEATVRFNAQFGVKLYPSRFCSRAVL